MTKFDFGKCWEMNIYEFFNYLSFCRHYSEKQRAMMERAKKNY